jgi:hypothetical protein
MIKFNCLIHKETGTVIKYEGWRKAAKRDDFIVVKGAEVFVNPKNIVKAKEMLFSDDFIIVYEPEFKLEELQIIFRGNQKYNEELMKKILKNINDKEFNREKYGIEG